MKYKIRTDLVLDLVKCKLYRIEALKDFSDIKKGDLGGYIESESNLSQEGNCWIYGNARVFDYAQVSGDAQVSGYARVHGNARVYGDAHVYGNARVYGDAHVYGNARVSSNAQVYGYARVSSNTQVSSNAQVSDYALVCGNAHVLGNARVYSNASINNSMVITSNKDLIYTSGVKYDITLTLTGINIGCKHYKDLNDFMSRVENEANENGYDEIEKKHLIKLINMNIDYLNEMKR